MQGVVYLCPVIFTVLNISYRCGKATRITAIREIITAALMHPPAKVTSCKFT